MDFTSTELYNTRRYNTCLRAEYSASDLMYNDDVCMYHAMMDAENLNAVYAG